MRIPKENVIDLRKRSPATEESPPALPELYDPNDFRIKPWINILALTIIIIILAALTAYFIISKNYLASSIFVLAGITLAIAVLTKKKMRKNTNDRETFLDALSKIIGL